MDLEESESETLSGVPHSFYLDDLAVPLPCDYCDELIAIGAGKTGYMRCLQQSLAWRY